jgi:hypothetical protein
VDRSINERQFTRLSRVARATRQGWAKDELIDRQSSPYTLLQLHHVVILSQLGRELPEFAVVWRQLSDGAKQAESRQPCEAVVDLYDLYAVWVTTDCDIAIVARRGHEVRLIDFTQALDEATAGFRLAVRGTWP